MKYARYEATQTLPAKCARMLKKSPLGDMVNGKKVAIKMHVGDGITYSTIPPVFISTLVDFIHEHGGDCFITDHYISARHPEKRGYTEDVYKRQEQDSQLRGAGQQGAEVCGCRR